ncbi:MAG: hypothetical protein MUO19_06605 [Dehalococcoidales bacterium]|nr:hypothetical protein [Dehalococcoidales bacterium]
MTLALAAFLTACAPPDFDDRLRDITASHRFSLAAWEITALAGEAGKLFGSRPDTSTDRSGEVIAYFNSTDRNPDITSQIEAIIEAQVRDAYREAGLHNPIDDRLRVDVGFPPVNIHLGKPPRLLVVSPRDRIERYRDVLLLPDILLEDIETIEEEVEALGYSALVVGLGGIASYPNYVTNDAGIRFILDTAAEEWLHQYLAFTPLGFYYVLDLLGIRQDDDIATMNETVAEIVAKEIGGRIYTKYYTQDEASDEAGDAEPAFDFNREMREIRKTVDDLLAGGEIEEAEAFMAERRDFLQDNGYYIRKLNQAYFAFHGMYAAGPASIDPIGDDFRELRSRSQTLEEFLDAAASLSNRDGLSELLR